DGPQDNNSGTPPQPARTPLARPAGMPAVTSMACRRPDGGEASASSRQRPAVPRADDDRRRRTLPSAGCKTVPSRRSPGVLLLLGLELVKILLQDKL
ncbi:unnamed protein product, partial [Urochloa humidicola]